MSAYTLGLYEKSMPHGMALRTKLESVKASGFDFLEASIDETDEKLSRLWWGAESRREVAAVIGDTGVPIGSMCLSGHRKYPLGSLDGSARRKGLDIMERSVGLACDWGIRIIQLAGYDVYYEPGNEKTRGLFTENLRKCVEMASRDGVLLAFETMETPFMDTVAKAMRYVKEIGSPYLQIYPDLGNLTNAALLYDQDLTDDMQTGHGHIAALHLKETSPGKYRDVSYGAGHVDFAAGARAAWGLGVRRFVGEFWDDGDYRPQLAHANAFLRGYLEEAAARCVIE